MRSGRNVWTLRARFFLERSRSGNALWPERGIRPIQQQRERRSVADQEMRSGRNAIEDDPTGATSVADQEMRSGRNLKIKVDADIAERSRSGNALWPAHKSEATVKIARA